MTTRRIVAVSAGHGQPSSTRLLADRLADAVQAAAHEHDVEVELEVIELRELARELTDHLMTGFASERVEAAKAAAAAADGLIALTPIHSGSYSAVFKAFFDVLDDGALAGTPVLLAATAGTPRHALAIEHALRPLFAYLRTLTVPTAVFAAGEDWGVGGDTDGALADRIDRAAGELVELVASREPVERPDSFVDPVPFEQLLRSS